MKSRIGFYLTTILIFSLTACNLPTQGNVPTPPENLAAVAVPLVSVSTASEFRTGPGENYDLVGVLQPGQQAEVVGRSPEGDYWLIQDPANPAALGWLKSGNAVVVGDTSKLSIPTSPPSPTSIGGPTSVVTPVNSPTPVVTLVSSPTPVATLVSSPTLVGKPTKVSKPTPIGPTPVGPTPVGPTPVGPTPVGPTAVK